jgi:hypothetical protein
VSCAPKSLKNEPRTSGCLQTCCDNPADFGFFLLRQTPRRGHGLLWITIPVSWSRSEGSGWGGNIVVTCLLASRKRIAPTHCLLRVLGLRNLRVYYTAYLSRPAYRWGYPHCSPWIWGIYAAQILPGSFELFNTRQAVFPNDIPPFLLLVCSSEQGDFRVGQSDHYR